MSDLTRLERELLAAEKDNAALRGRIDALENVITEINALPTRVRWKCKGGIDQYRYSYKSVPDHLLHKLSNPTALAGEETTDETQ